MRKYLIFLVFLSCPGWGWAQRSLPAEGTRAEVGAQLPLPLVMLGGQSIRLAPGAAIFDRDNRRLTHAQLLPGADVIYQLDRDGQVQRVFVLTPSEQSRLDRPGTK
jgi:hypothetical protein